MAGGSPGSGLRSVLAAACIAVSMTACVPPPGPAAPIQAQVPADFPAAWYRQAQAQGLEVLRVDPARSLVTIEVHRAGALARLGHEHVVASRDVQGYVAPDHGRADLYLRLDRMTVDEAELRIEHGLTQPVSQEAIEATRRNMLDKVLEAERFPFALIQVRGAARDGSVLDVSIALHGRVQRFAVPVRVTRDIDGLSVQGRLAFRHGDFGLVPYSALGGALQVGDQLDLSFRVFAGKKG